MKPKSHLQLKNSLRKLVAGGYVLYIAVGSLLMYAPGAAQAFSGVGNGSSDYPYQITTCDQFQAIADNTSADYTLVNDIDCNGFSWTAINGYSGTLNGNGYTVSNLSASVPNPGGIFTSTNDATIENLQVTNLTITTGGGDDDGGLVGEINGGLVSNVSVSGTITGGNSPGGVVGVVDGGSITNSSFTGSVSADDSWGGGLVGDLIDGTISNSYANATLTGTDGGGLVGQIIGDNGGTTSVTDSYVLGDVDYDGDSGGLTERIDQEPGSTVALTNNFVVASLNGGSVLYASLYSDTPTVSNNYFDATVAGTSTDCAAGSPISGCTAVNISGTDSTHFQDTTVVAPFTSWDFTNTWQKTSGYPTLQPYLPQALAEPTVPGTATDVQATAGTPKSTVNLTWTAAPDNGSDVTYSVLYKDLTAGDVGFTTYGTTSLITPSLTLTGLTLNHEYAFEIQATNAIGVGGISAPIDYTTTSDNSAVITNCDQLQAIDDNLSGSYTLGSNVNCYGSSSWNSGAGFSPIGLAEGYGTPFDGTLNGEGYSIEGLTINRSSTNNIGLFQQLTSATVENLGFSDSSIAGQNAVGTLSGRVSNSSISNVTVDGGSITAPTGTDQIGGLVGNDTADTAGYTVTDSHFNGSVAGDVEAGGLIGHALFVGIQNCYSAGTVTGSSDVGGMVGKFEDVWALINVYSQSNVSTTNDGSNIGGLVGQLGSATAIGSAYASGSVTSNFTSNGVGGLVGQDNGDINDSFAAGAVSAPNSTLVGAFIGNYVSGSGSDNFYDQTRTGQADATGAGSLTGVSAVDTTGSPNSAYFFNSLSNAPLSTWESSVWFAKANNFPVLAGPANNVTAITTAAHPTSITVSWPTPDNSDTADITSYTLQYRLGDLSNGWTRVTVPVNAGNSYTITGLLPNTAYSVAIITNIGDGQPSSGGVGVIATTEPLAAISQASASSTASWTASLLASMSPTSSAAASTESTTSSNTSSISSTDPTATTPTPAQLITNPASYYTFLWTWIDLLALIGVALGAIVVLRFGRR